MTARKSSCSPAAWVETTATVTSCRYQFRAGSALAFGVPLGEKFRITFDYYAHGRLYSDEFQSAVAIAQGEQIELAYNPLAPEENTRARRSTAASPGWSVTVVMVLLLVLLGLAFLRSCR